MSVRLGVISDTHGLLRREVADILKTCDEILHAGDVNSPSILDGLSAIAPLRVVRGNNDKEWAEHLPPMLLFEIEGVRLQMIHNRADLSKDLGDTQIIIFGHSHQYFQEIIDGRLWLNPGSCGKRRFGLEISLAILTLENGRWQVEKRLVPAG